jgi:hypothetical protein
MTTENDTITISKDEYNELISNQFFLQCLMGAGVDNWDGYEYAQETYQEQYGDN